jgi:hypothetical protein
MGGSDVWLDVLAYMPMVIAYWARPLSFIGLAGIIWFG